MSFDFDTPPDRRGSDSIKWAKYAGRDVLPMWVADMDFAAPPCVIDAVRARVDHRVFGYGVVPASLTEAVIAAFARDYQWSIEPDWLVWLPGLVVGLNAVCRAVGERGDAVMTATPVYPPFLSAPLFAERECLRVPLHCHAGTWQWDLDGAQAALTPRTRLLMLCHPHNPVGRAWTPEELAALADFAERNDLVVCSDEIHADLILAGDRRHRPFASLGEPIAARTITLMAPSKTYNIPGLGCSLAIVPNPALRRQLRHALRGIVPDVNVLGLVAAEAAYRHGAPWREALVAYLRGNLNRLMEALESLPGLGVTRPEATYLAWIDARGTGQADPHAFFERAGLGLSNGADFGAPGFVRFNFGCPRQTLELAIARLQRALSEPPL